MNLVPLFLIFVLATLPSALLPSQRPDRLAVRHGNKFGFIDPDGSLKIQPQYSGIGRFSEGLCAVSVDQKWGFIDESGAMVIPPTFDGFQPFSEGLAMVCHNKECFFIGPDGSRAFEISFNMGRSFSEGLACIYQNGRSGWINRSGLLTIDAIFEEVGDFNEDLAAVKNGKWGYINQEGKMVIDFQFDEASYFRYGRARARIGNAWGHIDKTGTFIIPPKFEFLGPRQDGIIIGTLNKKHYAVAPTGRLLYELPYAHMVAFNEGLMAVNAGSHEKPIWGYVDRTGRTAIEPQFDGADWFSEGLAAVRNKDGKWGYIDRTGAWIIPAQFVEARAFLDGIAEVTAGSDLEPFQTYIKKDGTYLWHPKESSP